MRWIVLNTLDPENLKSDPQFDWALVPTFYKVNDEGDEEELLWAVSLYHRHWGTSDDTESLYEDCNSPPDMFRCGLVNREDVQKNNARPEYECDKCGKKVPKKMIEEKIERQRSLRGVDPRNNRRGAVLATRESNLIDTKES